jgi:uncharacterized protein (TIGR03435 family)
MKYRRIAGSVPYCAFTLLRMTSFGQPVTTPSFEVASIKLHVATAQEQGGRVGVWIGPGNRVSAYVSTLNGLAAYAYDVKAYRISGGPAWAATDRYDITAKTEGDGTPGEEIVRKMMQTLLADRFGLKFHREMKSLPMYALVAAKNGPKLRESSAGVPSSMELRPGQLSATSMSMKSLVPLLSRFVDRPVLDQTGLTGNYDFKLQWTLDAGLSSGFGPGADASSSDSAGPSLFTAVQEQLGLKLESQKGPMEVLEIDHAEKPSEN